MFLGFQSIVHGVATKIHQIRFETFGNPEKLCVGVQSFGHQVWRPISSQNVAFDHCKPQKKCRFVSKIDDMAGFKYLRWFSIRFGIINSDKANHTTQKNATQGDFWFHRAGHRAAWPRARGCLVHERLTVGQCSWETPNTSQKKRTSFQFQYFGAIDLNSDPTDPSQPLLKATVKHRGRGTCWACFPMQCAKEAPHAAGMQKSGSAAGVQMRCRIRSARSAVGLGGLVASWHRFTVGRIGQPVGCSKVWSQLTLDLYT